MPDELRAHRRGRRASRAPRVEQRTGAVRFRSIAELVSTERACVWTLGGILDEAQFERLLGESETTLAPFAGRRTAAWSSTCRR